MCRKLHTCNCYSAHYARQPFRTLTRGACLASTFLKKEVVCSQTSMAEFIALGCLNRAREIWWCRAVAFSNECTALIENRRSSYFFAPQKSPQLQCFGNRVYAPHCRFAVALPEIGAAEYPSHKHGRGIILRHGILFGPIEEPRRR